MKKEDVTNIIKEAGLVAVIRSESAEQAVKISKACIDGGIKVIEITFTVPNAEDAISKLVGEYKDADVLIGAGSVLNIRSLLKAESSGAGFIVSPYLVYNVANMCSYVNLPYIPGAMTLKEVAECIETGAGIVKIFPCELLSPVAIKAYMATMKGLQLMPTGGVDLDNVEQWIKAGAVAVGVGGNLTRGAKTGEFDLVTQTARKFLEKIKNARGIKL